MSNAVPPPPKRCRLRIVADVGWGHGGARSPAVCCGACTGPSGRWNACESGHARRPGLGGKRSRALLNDLVHCGVFGNWLAKGQ
jgi:hypothetical protein